MLCDALPRVPLACLPTPLEPAYRLSEALGGPEIWFKRDDRAGLSYGGNKTRLMEYVMADVQAQGCDAVVAAASIQSNKMRETAAAAARLGLRAVLCLHHGDALPPQGNRLLFELLGAEVRPLKPEESDGAADLEVQQRIRAELAEQGHNAYVMDRRLQYGALSTVAYVHAAEELAGQCAERGVEPDAAFISVGAGMTAAGLALGLKRLGSGVRVEAVCASQRAEQVWPDVLDYAARAADALGWPEGLAEGELTLHDTYLGPGYGVLTPEIARAIRLVARTEGVLLDPVYTGKTMAGLMDRIRRGHLRKGQRVVFVHTGGVPALFAYNAELSAPEMHAAEG